MLYLHLLGIRLAGLPRLLPRPLFQLLIEQYDQLSRVFLDAAVEAEQALVRRPRTQRHHTFLLGPAFSSPLGC